MAGQQAHVMERLSKVELAERRNMFFFPSPRVKFCLMFFSAKLAEFVCYHACLKGYQSIDY